MSGVITPIKVASAGVNVPNNLVPPAKVLVLGCIDPRFASQLEWFLTHQAGIFGQYDLFVLAGASLGVNQAQSYRDVGAGGESATDGTNYNNGLVILNNWDSNFYAHLSIALRIHDITDVWIFDHLDCGAYKLIKFGALTETDEDIDEHSVEIERLAGNISGYTEVSGEVGALGPLPIPFSELNIKGFVMDLSGNIFKVYDDGQSNNGGGYDITASSSSSSVWVIPVIISAFVLLFIYFKFFMTPKL
jgi:hypothetical protein